MEKKLTPKQELFVSEYLKTGNATEAARKAGYKGNDVTLGAVGAENLKKPQIIDAIKLRDAKRSKRMELEEDFELKTALELLKEARDDGDIKNANAVLQTLCKIRGKFVTKIQVGLADDLDAQLGRIPDGNEP